MLQKNEIVGDYELIKFLGKGQFGEVWLAEKQIQFSKKKIRHALKFLLNHGAGDIDLTQAQDEIDTWIEAGGHPNVISVLDMLVHDGQVVIISEYADGGSLKDWLKFHGGKTPTHEKALELMSGILRGIEHLHSRNVVHRDLKPENILLQGDFARITDFGISRIVSENTTTTQAIGSPSYMSPEAFLGNKSPSTDIWSAGIILYEMLTGEVPFKGANIFYIKESIEKDEAPPLTENISKELQDVIGMALQKDRTKRLQTAREMRLGLETASYSLRKNSDEATVPYDDADPLAATQAIPPVPAVEIPPDKTQPSATMASELVKSEPAPPAKTQSAVSHATDGKVLEQTKQWQEPAEAKDSDYEAEILNIGESLKQQAGQNASRASSKILLGGLIAGILAIIGVGIFLALRASETVASNSNLSQSNSNVSAAAAASEPPRGMAYIPGGEFQMGRADGKSDAEKPVRTVSIEPFFMDLTEVTNDQYAEFVKATNHRPPGLWKNGAFPKGQAKLPVVGVNWEDADAYAKWAEKRLPTEEEWEFAARGAAGFLYPWGDEWKPGNANAGGASQTFSDTGKYSGKSPFGLSDMVGNAWEWTASDFKAYPNGKLPEAFAGKDNLKTIRGGSFEATKDFATATYRIGWAATGADSYSRTGFRCAKNIVR